MIRTLSILLLLMFSLAFAEQESNENAAPANDEQAETKKDKQTNNTVNTPDSFDPTETLSQDLPTAFPVDI